MMPTTTTPNLPHEDYCGPAIGETEPRIESFTATRTDDRGTVTSRPRITRCMECAAQVVQG